VVKGSVGDTPLIGWVVDYPTLERLHYLLVAGFDIYGTAGHQIASRTYMDILHRMPKITFYASCPPHNDKTSMTTGMSAQTVCVSPHRYSASTIPAKSTTRPLPINESF